MAYSVLNFKILLTFLPFSLIFLMFCVLFFKIMVSFGPISLFLGLFLSVLAASDVSSRFSEISMNLIVTAQRPAEGRWPEGP